MKISFSTLGCPQWHWRDILSMAHDMGFSGIEVRGIRSEIYAPKFKYFQSDVIAQTRQKLASLHLEVPCLTSGCDLFRPQRREENLQEVRDYIDVAHALGTPYIRVLGDDVLAPGHLVDTALVRDLCQELGAYAQQKGVTLLLETNGYYADSEKLKKTLDEIGSSAVKALWDVHHPFRYNGETPEETVRILGDDIRHVHIKDSVVEHGAVRYKMLGYGDVPIQACVDALAGIGYDGYYSLEWVKRWDLTLEDPGIVFAQFAAVMPTYAQEA
nr:sugar phosphate isomerase/epimerase family protein [Maliibacterium massiliense]